MVASYLQVNALSDKVVKVYSKAIIRSATEIRESPANNIGFVVIFFIFLYKKACYLFALITFGITTIRRLVIH